MSANMHIPMAINAINVTRYYGIKRGVRDFNLTVPTGSILGLIGENGCGKTTALKLTMGALLPDTGKFFTLGADPGFMTPEVRARIGWLSDQLAVPDRFDLSQAMALQQSYFPQWNQTLAFDLAATFGLTETSVFRQLSLGQKRRFMLILVVAQMPDLLILDEPASGLDTAVRRQLMEILIDQAAQRPMTILLSSHILSDVERLVDHVAFMKDGAAIVQGELENLRSRVKRICATTKTAEVDIQNRFHIIHTDFVGETWRAVVDDFDERQLTSDMIVEHLNLEELFLIYNQTQSSKLAVR